LTGGLLRVEGCKGTVREEPLVGVEPEQMMMTAVVVHTYSPLKKKIFHHSADCENRYLSAEKRLAVGP
jgi:hypothetical protein